MLYLNKETGKIHSSLKKLKCTITVNYCCNAIQFKRREKVGSKVLYCKTHFKLNSYHKIYLRLILTNIFVKDHNAFKNEMDLKKLNGLFRIIKLVMNVVLNCGLL